MNVPTCSEEEYRESFALTLQHAPAFAPLGWAEIDTSFDRRFEGMKRYRRKGDGMVVILSASRWPNDAIPERVWLHVSMSFRNKLPTYQDMCEVKRLFIGPHLRAIQIFAEGSQHVNICETALHLGAEVNNNLQLPDFGAWGSI